LALTGEPGWLNDEPISLYMGMLQMRDDRLCRGTTRRPSHFFNSFFISQLQLKGYTFAAVSRWTKSFDVFEMHAVYVPVNNNNIHWTLAVIHVQVPMFL
jgi:sentrin-specific protease 1